MFDTIADMPTIILVEDDLEIARLSTMFLESEGFQVKHVSHGDWAVDIIRNTPSDLLLLDIMLPGKSGIEICQEVRRFYTQPILMLTACEDDLTEISSLNTGADDYIKKPIRPHVLLAHIHALLRRNQPNQSSTLHIADITINLKRREIRYADSLVSTTSAEFDLLALLAERPGEVLSRETCYQRLRGIEYDGLDRAIDMRVASIRKKLQAAGCQENPLKTVRGKGYMLIGK